jgi:hypothetical protein
MCMVSQGFRRRPVEQVYAEAGVAERRRLVRSVSGYFETWDMRRRSA